MRRRIPILHVLAGIAVFAGWDEVAAQKPSGAPIERAAGKVTLIRDEWGTPHVFAKREEDGYFGWGYAMAQDRLPNLLWRYIAAKGRLAETFGADLPARYLGALDFPASNLEADAVHLRFMTPENGVAGFKRLDPQLRANYSAFAAGIERFMADNPAKVPAWAPKKIEPESIVMLTWSWFFPWALGGQGVQECRAPGIQMASDVRGYAAGEAVGLSASNAWVIMPSRTAFKAAAHLGDSHGPWGGPGEMYQVRVNAGRLNFFGTGVLGLPFTLSGHSNGLAWTTSNARHDVTDCYEIETDPANPRRYQFDGAWKSMVVRTVTIPVKNGAPVSRTYEYTEHNGVLSPVVGRSGTKAYALSTPYWGASEKLDEQVYRQHIARDADEFMAAQDILGLWPNNQMVADSKGNVQYIRAGRIPIRPEGYDWTKPVPGNTSATKWRGIHKPAELVQLRNPPQGYMQNNNVAPDMMMLESPLTADKYPAWVFSDRAGRSNWRGYRAVQLLSSARAATVNDLRSIAMDQSWAATSQWIQALDAAIKSQPAGAAARGDDFRKLTQQLLGFDGVARKESKGALVYDYWRRAIHSVDSAGHSALSDAIEGVTRDHQPNAAGIAGPQIPLTSVQQRVLLDAVDRAANMMRADLGSTDLAYGDAYRIGRGKASWPIGGGGVATGSRVLETLGVAWFTTDTLAKRVLDLPTEPARARWMIYGQRMPLLTVFTSPIQSFTWAAVGQSDDSTSSHYTDQARLLSERTLRPTHFYEQDLLKNSASRVTLDTKLGALEAISSTGASGRRATAPRRTN